MPYCLILESAMLENVTLTTLPVALKSVLIRSPFVEFVTTESANLVNHQNLEAKLMTY